MFVVEPEDHDSHVKVSYAVQTIYYHIHRTTVSNSC